jgi:hypothetical protein
VSQLALTAELPTSAHRETVWARALRDGLYRHGPTPTYDALAPMLEPLEEPAVEQPHNIAEPGTWAVVEAGCVHDPTRRPWVHHPDGNWWPAVPYSVVAELERPILPDDWTSLLEPTLIRNGLPTTCAGGC